MKALIFDIYKGTTTDGPGMRDTVFFKGCPLSCKWCHNPEGIDFKNRIWYEIKTCIGCGLCSKACSNDAITADDAGIKISVDKCKMCGNCSDICPTGSLSPVANEFSVDLLSAEILKDKEYFDISGGGVTASGGEAMMHAEFLREFFRQMKSDSISTALDTTGFCDSEKLVSVLEYTDIVLYDLKVINSQLHKEFTGVDNNIILDNLISISNLIKSGANLRLIIRTPIITGFTDREEIIREIALFIKDNLCGTVEKWELCAFNNSCVHKYKKLGKIWNLSASPLISAKKMESLIAVAEKSGVSQINHTGILTE